MSRLSWSVFTPRRVEHLHALGAPILEGVARRDTRHPAFHGCFDWHSAVHGCYALLLLSRLTGDSHYRQVAETVMSEEALAAEKEALCGGGLEHELPYGFAWLLRLSLEGPPSSPALERLAAVAAERLQHWLQALEGETAEQAVHAGDYGNASWALENLFLYAERRGEAERLSCCRELASRLLLGAPCPDLDEESEEFFSPSLMRASALLTVLPQGERRAWLARSLPWGGSWEPIGQPARIHQAGQNWSRAWGLWALYRESGLDAFLQLYQEHVLAHLAQPAYWREDYAAYSHWVPQFGVVALALSAEDGVCE